MYGHSSGNYIVGNWRSNVGRSIDLHGERFGRGRCAYEAVVCLGGRLAHEEKILILREDHEPVGSLDRTYDELERTSR